MDATGRDLPVCLGRRRCHGEDAGYAGRDGGLADRQLSGLEPLLPASSQRGLKQHFTALADRAASPIVLYNIPYRSAVNLTNEMLLALAEHQNIVGMKDCGADRAASIELLRLAGRLSRS